MKRSAFFFLLGFMLSPAIFAQTGWTWQNPTPDGNTLNDVAIFGGKYAVAVGDLGLILRSEDKGETWAKISSSTKSRLNSIAMTDNGTGWIVGAGGTVLKTTDNGLTWIKQSIGNYYSLYAVATSDGVNCYAGGYLGKFNISKDGGATWSVSTTNSTKDIRSIFVQSRGVVYISQDAGIIERTGDDGLTWTNQTTGITSAIFEIALLGSNGFAVGAQGKLLRTTDAGANWSLVPVHEIFDLTSVRMMDASKILVVGVNGQLLTSTNGGSSFESKFPFQNNVSQYAIAYDPGNYYLSVGEAGQINKSTNGVNWTVTTARYLPYFLYDVFFTDVNHGVVAGDIGCLLLTHDGGTTWVNKSPQAAQQYTYLYFINDNIGFASSNVALARTTDGGNSWTEVLSHQATPAMNGDFESIFFVDSNYGWAVTNMGEIFWTKNSGLTWSAAISGVTKLLSGVFFANRKEGIAMGSGGTFLNSADSGRTWNKVNSSFTGDFRSMHAFDLKNIIAISTGGLNRTSDGGLNWSPVTVPASAKNGMYKIRFVNPNTGWICGEHGIIIKTTDGGTTWASQVSNLELDLFSIFFTDENNGWAVGQDGIIIHTGNGGISGISETGRNAPKGFLLSQNYPNPFDQSTTLTIDLPKRSPVKLEMFSITGVKVATLLDDEREAGKHQIRFDGSGLPGGIYFCRCTWGNSGCSTIRLVKE